MSDTKTSATPSSTSRHGKRVEDIDKLQATFVRARTSLVPCSVCFLLGAVLAGAGAYVATFLVACTIGLLVGFVLGIKFNRAEDQGAERLDALTEIKLKLFYVQEDKDGTDFMQYVTFDSFVLTHLVTYSIEYLAKKLLENKELRMHLESCGIKSFDVLNASAADKRITCDEFVRLLAQRKE